MKITLSDYESRIIGCLIEKEITTPDQYPLSLNALTNACNQKSNRDPVLVLSEDQVRATVDGLVQRHLILEKAGFGSRVPKFQQRFCNSDFGATRFTPQQLAIVCELLLRGPQTPGELRSRAERMCKFHDVAEVEQCLADLAANEDGPIVARLPREAGRRDARFMHLYGADGAVPATLATAPPPVSDTAATELSRLDVLEQAVRQLRVDLDALKARLGD